MLDLLPGLFQLFYNICHSYTIEYLTEKRRSLSLYRKVHRKRGKLCAADIAKTKIKNTICAIPFSFTLPCNAIFASRSVTRKCFIKWRQKFGEHFHRMKDFKKWNIAKRVQGVQESMIKEYPRIIVTYTTRGEDQLFLHEDDDWAEDALGFHSCFTQFGKRLFVLLLRHIFLVIHARYSRFYMPLARIKSAKIKFFSRAKWTFR